MTNDLDIEITKTHKMSSEDWQPLIDAMAYLKNLPQCGDVANGLHELFIAAQKGEYYFIEMGFESQKGKQFIVGDDFNNDQPPVPSGR